MITSLPITHDEIVRLKLRRAVQKDRDPKGPWAARLRPRKVPWDALRHLSSELTRVTWRAAITFATIACGAGTSSPSPDGGFPVEGGSSDIARKPNDVADPTFCTRSSECFIKPADCCQNDCMRDALVTRNSRGFDGYLTSCVERGCTPCRVSGRWVPQCVENRCTIVDLENSDLSACRAAADCKMRWGAVCCEPCSPDPAFDLVSVSRAATFCAAGDSCDPCGLPSFPATASVVCVDEHCRLQP